MPDSPSGAKSFWIEAFAWRGAVSVRVLPTTIAFGAFATLIYLIHAYVYDESSLAIEVGPHEVAGALLGLLLVMRTNAGYDRWWEARKLWGGIINESRNLVLTALAHGPAEGRWRESIVRWTIAFAYAAKARLRGDREVPELRPLLGEEQAKQVRAAEHVPLCIALIISELLREGCEIGMDRFAFLQAERGRSGLIVFLGGCDRIRNTPLATLYSITIRSFIVLFLFSLPFALLHKFEAEWLAPLTTTVVAWAVLSLDQIGVELQQPFSTRSLNHLPLDEFCHTIEKNLLALLDEANT